MSLRLRGVLAEHASRVAIGSEPGSPDPDALVVDWSDQDNLRKRFFHPVARRAGFDRLAMQDLRTTFASQLLTHGIPIEPISRWLGQATTAITETAYTKWVSDRAHVEPMQLDPLELPVDILARIAPSSRWEHEFELDLHRTVHTPGHGQPNGGHGVGTIRGAVWRAQHDSNVRPSGPQPASQPDANLKRLRVPPRTPRRRARRGLVGTM